jgi:hypothetical protein
MKLDPADIAFSKWVRLRDRKCMRCHSPVKFNEKGLPVSHQASHFKGRAKEATRYEPLNVDCICGGCHRYLTAQPDEHMQFQIKLKGQATVDKIILLASTYKKKDRALEALYWKEQLSKDFNI